MLTNVFNYTLQEFTFNVSRDELASKTLEVTVWDKDIGRNDYIGRLNCGSWGDDYSSGPRYFMSYHGLWSRSSSLRLGGGKLAYITSSPGVLSVVAVICGRTHMVSALTKIMIIL